MADELQNYKLQLQQVEAALLSDPDNRELQKLKVDLEEVIDLTLDLKTKAEEAAKQPEYRELTTNLTEEDEVTRSLLAVEQFVAKNKNKKIWRIGDICMAKWSDNGQYAEARIDTINPDGQVNVTFEAYKNRGVTTLAELKEFTGQKRVLTEAEKLKRAKMNNKEYLKRKKAKKMQRFKELEEERETEKKKWLAFTTKSRYWYVRYQWEANDRVHGRREASERCLSSPYRFLDCANVTQLLFFLYALGFSVSIFKLRIIVC